MSNTTRGANARKQKSLEKENGELLRCISGAKLELEIANRNFSYATDPLLVDVYAYQIKAAQAKYSYFLQKARLQGLRCQGYEHLKNTSEIS